ncbi:hypothetical protein DFH09DRAFT_1300018 [Mycena vulgaris]|nr:hypothetical protein DFH09DRAFT_1300018 [Mycena vulgaris]
MSLPWSTLIKLLSCLPSVEALDAYLVFFVPPTTTDLHSASLATSLTRLELRMCYNYAAVFFASLLTLRVLPILKSLKLDGYLVDGDDWSPIAVYMERAGEGLESLKIAGPREVSAARFYSGIFPHTIALRELAFVAVNVSSLLDILSSLTGSDHLVSITVTLHVFNWYEPWEALDAALAHPRRFTALKRFSFPDPYVIKPLSPAIKALTPQADAHGILD